MGRRRSKALATDGTKRQEMVQYSCYKVRKSAKSNEVWSVSYQGNVENINIEASEVREYFKKQKKKVMLSMWKNPSHLGVRCLKLGNGNGLHLIIDMMKQHAYNVPCWSRRSSPAGAVAAGRRLALTSTKANTTRGEQISSTNP